MASVIINRAGLLTTVQDTGRYGYQRYGMPVSGAMDTFSCELANLLVGNDPGDACLEATVAGPELSSRVKHGSHNRRRPGAAHQRQQYPSQYSPQREAGRQAWVHGTEERLQVIYRLCRRDSCPSGDGQSFDISQGRYRRIPGPGTHPGRRAAAGRPSRRATSDGFPKV